MEVTPVSVFISSLPKNSPLKKKRAKEIFIEKANQLITLRILTPFDLEQLSIYAYALDQAYSSMEKISALGCFKETYDDNGRILRYVENPYLKLFRDMVDIANKIGSDFGFSPVSRQKLKAGKPKKDDDLSRLLDI